MKTGYAASKAYVTKDGSSIRELMHPQVHGEKFGVAKQSLAEALVLPGQRTSLHRHGQTEELYFITAGSGLMTLDGETFVVSVGDTVCITPGTAHCIENTANQELRFLCCCSPAYSHADTELLE
jgi:mannose-6-phosphate isomerase-like protein (cupin superfamily)